MVKKIGLSVVKIAEIFQQVKAKRKPEQYRYWIGLFKHVFPDWNKIKSLNQYPKVSKTTSDIIFQFAIDFDMIYHKDCLSGGLWMNRGFSFIGNTPKDWIVSYDESKITYYTEHELRDNSLVVIQDLITLFSFLGV